MCVFLLICELFAFVLLLIVTFADLAGDRKLFQSRKPKTEPPKIEDIKEEKMKIQDSVSDKKQ